MYPVVSVSFRACGVVRLGLWAEKTVYAISTVLKINFLAVRTTYVGRYDINVHEKHNTEKSRGTDMFH